MTETSTVGMWEPNPPALSAAILAELAAARRDWTAARNYFESVSDPALVDHAVYLLQAAERKYQYLLHEARRAREMARAEAATASPALAPPF